MPLAVEDGLNIEMPDLEYIDCGTVTKYRVARSDVAVDFTAVENPLRAICEVLVMIKLE